MRAPKFIRSKDGVLIAVQHIAAIGEAIRDANLGRDVHVVWMTNQLYFSVPTEEIARIV